MKACSRLVLKSLLEEISYAEVLQLFSPWAMVGALLRICTNICRVRNNERILYHIAAHTKQRLHDAGLVWASQIIGNRCQHPLAIDRGHCLFLGNCIL